MSRIRHLNQLREELNNKIREANAINAEATMELVRIDQEEREYVFNYWKDKTLDGKCFRISRDSESSNPQYTYYRIIKNGGTTVWGFSVAVETITVERDDRNHKTYYGYDLGNEVIQAAKLAPENLVEECVVVSAIKEYVDYLKDEAVRLVEAEK
ncbi:MAG: hypothetical protein LUD72_12160 [Bacteroidales bacterium]|nr:hypothetical protein [Bacteroidales bacterium]